MQLASNHVKMSRSALLPVVSKQNYSIDATGFQNSSMLYNYDLSSDALWNTGSKKDPVDRNDKHMLLDLSSDALWNTGSKKDPVDRNDKRMLLDLSSDALWSTGSEKDPVDRNDNNMLLDSSGISTHRAQRVVHGRNMLIGGSAVAARVMGMQMRSFNGDESEGMHAAWEAAFLLLVSIIGNALLISSCISCSPKSTRSDDSNDHHITISTRLRPNADKGSLQQATTPQADRKRGSSRSHASRSYSVLHSNVLDCQSDAVLNQAIDRHSQPSHKRACDAHSCNDFHAIAERSNTALGQGNNQGFMQSAFRQEDAQVESTPGHTTRNPRHSQSKDLRMEQAACNNKGAADERILISKDLRMEQAACNNKGAADEHILISKDLRMEQAACNNKGAADERILISESDMVVMKLVYGTGQMQRYKDSSMKALRTQQTPVHHKAEHNNSLHQADSLPVMGLSLTNDFEKQSMLLSSANLNGFFHVAKATTRSSRDARSLGVMFASEKS
jgi:hypothetical protein